MNFTSQSSNGEDNRNYEKVNVLILSIFIKSANNLENTSNTQKSQVFTTNPMTFSPWTKDRTFFLEKDIITNQLVYLAAN